MCTTVYLRHIHVHDILQVEINIDMYQLTETPTILVLCPYL